MGYIIVDLEFNNLKNITKYYEKFFEENNDLKDINLEVKPGEIVGLVGENGAGKSTLMKNLKLLMLFKTISLFVINILTTINKKIFL